MSKNKDFLNPGGINGTGKGLVNVNSADFKALRQAVIEDSKKQSPQERMQYALIGLKLQIAMACP